jgi:Zn-dependent protease with chaperone function
VSLVGPGLAYVASTALFAVTLWSYGRIVSRRDRKTAIRKFGRVLILPAIITWRFSTPRGVEIFHEVIAGSIKTGLFGVAIVELFLLFALGVQDTVATGVASAAGVPATGLLASAVAATALVVPPLVSVLVCYLPSVGHLRRLRDLDLSRARAARRLGRSLVYFGLVGIPATTLYLTGPSGWTIVAATVLGFLVLHVGGAAIARRTADAREPTDEEATRLDRLCERAGFDPARTWVIPLDEEESVMMSVRGLPGRRELFVSSYLLDVLDDDRLTALLSINGASARRWHFERRMGLLLAFILVGMVAVFGLLPVSEDANLLVAVVGMPVVVGIMWRMRRVTYRADDAAAERVGAERVRAVLEWLVEEEDAPADHGRLTTLLNLAPPLEKRMARLRPGGARPREAGTPPGPGAPPADQPRGEQPPVDSGRDQRADENHRDHHDDARQDDR